MEGNTSFKKFWFESLKVSLTYAHGFTSWFGILAIILGFISWANPDWEEPVNILVWASPLGIFVVGLIIGLLKTPYTLFQTEAKKVQKYETEEIDLVAENSKQYVRLENRRGIWVCRVGVKALGQRTIRGVQVYLRAYDGNEHELGDAPLCPAERLRNVSGAIVVNPGVTQRFIEVLQWNPQKHEMNIPYNLNYQLAQAGVNLQKYPLSLPTLIDEGSHTLTLYATGENMKPVEREFRVEIIRGKKLNFSRINHE